MLLAVIMSSVILLVNIIVMSSNTSITSIFMLTLLHQIELKVYQKTRHNCDVVKYVNYVNFYVDFVASN